MKVTIPTKGEEKGRLSRDNGTLVKLRALTFIIG